jgi:iron complex outermembrane receptor protein
VAPGYHSKLASLLVGVGVAAGLPAFADTGPIEPAVAQAGRTATFDIPSQPLAQALTGFGRQSGLQIAVDTAATTGKTSGAVSGTMAVEEALRRLLAGTGLTFQFTSVSAVTVSGVSGAASNAVQLDPVRVQGSQPSPPQAEINNLTAPYAGGLVARGGRVGDLGNRDYMDTPFSTTVYTEKYIQDNQARTLVDALADDPTIRSTYAQGVYDDRLFIRGFYLDPGDMSFNGLYGVNPVMSVNLAGIERIEVFRGPTALLSGMSPIGSIGGTMNFVPKRATDTPITQMAARYASDGQVGGQIDFGRRFGPDNSVGLRMNGTFMAGNTAIARNSDQLAALTLGLDFRSDTTRLDADFGYQNRRIIGAQGGTFVATGLQVPAAPNARNNYYQPWEFYATEDMYGMLRFEHDFMPNLTAFLKVGGLRSNGAFLLGFPTINDAQGNTSSSPFKNVTSNESVSAEVGARGRFDTGPVHHEAVLSGSYLRMDRGNGATTVSDVASNIYAPVIQPAPDLAGAVTSAPLVSATVQTSIGLIDAISIAQNRVQLIGGVRAQRIQVSNYDGTTGLPTPGYDQSVVTPSVSLIVKPWDAVSFYANYIEALEQGPTAGAGLANAGEVFAPFVSRQFEVGAKLDLGNFGAMLSAFQITRPSSFVDPTTNSLVVDGQQRNRGIEFTMFGEPLPGLKPIGGFTVLDAIQTNTLDGATNGKYAPGVPTFQANIGLDWSTPFLKGFALLGRVIYTAQSYVDPANTQAVPPWTRIDLGARYTFERPDGQPVSLRFNAINVGNNNYWMASNGYLSQGQPRTFLLSLTADF